MVTKQEFVKVLLFSILTCGIYYYYWIYKTTEGINTMAGEDGNRTEPTTVILLTIVTCGIYFIYWLYCQGNRMHAIANANGIQTTENGTTYLMWYIIGAFICGVCSWIGIFLFIKQYNLIADRYNGGTY